MKGEKRPTSCRCNRPRKCAIKAVTSKLSALRSKKKRPASWRKVLLKCRIGASWGSVRGKKRKETWHDR